MPTLNTAGVNANDQRLNEAMLRRLENANRKEKEIGKASVPEKEKEPDDSKMLLRLDASKAPPSRERATSRSPPKSRHGGGRDGASMVDGRRGKLLGTKASR